MAAPDSPDWTTNISRPSEQLAGSPWAYSSGTSTRSFNVQPDCHALGLIAPGFANITSLTVTGNVSGATLYSSVANGNIIQNPVFAQVIGAIDTSVTVSVTATSGATLYVGQIHDPQVVSAILQPTVNDVFLTGLSGGLLFPTTLFGSSPPPWMAANRYPIDINTGTLANNAVFNILPAVSGRTYYLHEIYLYPVQGISDYTLSDTSGTTFARSDLGPIGAPNNVFIPPHSPMPMHGFALGTGLGLQMTNITGGNAAWFGYCAYSY